MPKLIALSRLHPTQMTVGMKEVSRRKSNFLKLDSEQRQDYIAERTVPCVRGPGDTLYMIDRHHMCRVLLEAGASTAACELKSDLTSLGQDEFWRYMDLRGWVHPFDSDGRRCPVSAVPRTLGELVDDPYRALAGVLRRVDGFTKAETPFEEFIWADFLRFRIEPQLVQGDFDKASAVALTLAHSAEARHLPGWSRSP